MRDFRGYDEATVQQQLLLFEWSFLPLLGEGEERRGEERRGEEGKGEEGRGEERRAGLFFSLQVL